MGVVVHTKWCQESSCSSDISSRSRKMLLKLLEELLQKLAVV